MAKDDTFTCIVLVVAIFLFVLYMNNSKVIEGHAGTADVTGTGPDAILLAQINDPSHLPQVSGVSEETMGPIRQCVAGCYEKYSVPEDSRRTLNNTLEMLRRDSSRADYTTSAQTETTQSNVEATLERIRLLELSFRKGGEGADAKTAPYGLCTNLVDGLAKGVGEGGGPSEEQCWTRAKEQFRLLRNVRTAFHNQDEQDLNEAKSATTDDADKAELEYGDVGIPKDYMFANKTVDLAAGSFDNIKKKYETYNVNYANNAERGLPTGWNEVAGENEGGLAEVGQPKPHCKNPTTGLPFANQDEARSSCR